MISRNIASLFEKYNERIQMAISLAKEEDLPAESRLEILLEVAKTTPFVLEIFQILDRENDALRKEILRLDSENARLKREMRKKESKNDA